ASNTITNTITAEVDGSSLTSGGGIDLSALADQQVVSATAAGAVSGSFSSGSQGGLAFAGAGAVSVNVITNTVAAQVSHSHLLSHGSQAVSLTAEDDSLITANAGALGVGAGVGGRDLAAGASVAADVITNDVSSVIDSSTVDSGGDVDLSAAEAAMIVAGTVGVSGAVAGGSSGGTSLAGSGSGSGNTTRNKVKAAITGGSSVNAGGRLSLSSDDDASITAAAGAGSLAIAAGGQSNVGVALGLSLPVNDILDSSSAIIVTSTVETTGGGGLDAT